MSNPVVSKILQTLFTSFLIFYCKKIVFSIDKYLSNTFNKNNHIVCGHCGSPIRLDVIQNKYNGHCYKCGTLVNKNYKPIFRE